MTSKVRRKQRTRSRAARPPARAAQPAAPAQSAAPALPAAFARPTALGRDAVPAQTAAPSRVAAPASRAPDPAPPASGGCLRGIETEVMGQVLTATCWLDPGDSGPGGPVTVRFTGRRTGITGAPARGDRFEHEETVDEVLPGCGPVSVTTRINDVNAGEWLVRARVVARPGHQRTVTQLGLPDAGSRAHVLRRALWPKGNPVVTESPGAPASTRLAAFATGPGIITASWSAMVAAGVALALGLLTVLLSRVHIDIGRALAVSAVVCLVGIVGARGWYVMLQRG